MTMFWWARALKASHIEQARGFINAYAHGTEPSRSHLELAFGHMRAISAIEDAVEKEKGTLRDVNAKALSIDVLATIGKMLDAYNGWVSCHPSEFQYWRKKPLEILDGFEELHLHIIYS